MSKCDFESGCWPIRLPSEVFQSNVLPMVDFQWLNLLPVDVCKISKPDFKNPRPFRQRLETIGLRLN